MLGIKFLDTNVLLSHLEVAQRENSFLISSVTLCELKEIKSSARKSEDIRYAARRAVRYINENPEKYKVIIYDISSRCDFTEYGLEDTPDNRILRCAEYAKNVLGYSHLVFVSDDILARLIGKEYFNLEVEDVGEEQRETYKGFIERILADEELAYFYEHQNENIYNLLTNQYIILKNKDDEIVDSYRWTGSGYDGLFKKTVKSISFGDKLKPKDIYQSIAIDSLYKNTMTAISGKAGSGKSLLSLMVSMFLIESGKYDRLVILYNPISVRGAQPQGYYPGSATEKAMQSGIGHILTTKFGDRVGVDMLISQDKIKLVCMSDCRGMEIRDNEILYISEAENTSIDLMKICLSRVSSGAKVFIEGDYEQIDGAHFQGNGNGMRRVIEKFRGQPEFGYVELQNVWRSRIAELCELL